jgi:hypothetical protein
MVSIDSLVFHFQCGWRGRRIFGDLNIISVKVFLSLGSQLTSFTPFPLTCSFPLSEAPRLLTVCCYNQDADLCQMLALAVASPVGWETQQGSSLQRCMSLWFLWGVYGWGVPPLTPPPVLRAYLLLGRGLYLYEYIVCIPLTDPLLH